jgi:2-polyprenyl-6-methoxyphenol hydroxylase-like FAD-dependent oxidoreductase
MTATPVLPIAVIGAGPVGLAAAAHLVARGETPLVLDAGPTPAAIPLLARTLAPAGRALPVLAGAGAARSGGGCG